MLAGIVALVLWHRSSEEEALKNRTQQMSVPTVLVVKPQPGSMEVHLNLPGTVSALLESSVYAQVSGYIKAWHTDIGAVVKSGDLLAEIDTPVTRPAIEAGRREREAGAGQSQPGQGDRGAL